MSNHKQSQEIDGRLTRIEVDTSSAIVELLEPTYFLTYTTHVRVNSVCVRVCMSLMVTIQRKLTIPYQLRTIWNELTVQGIRENIYSHYFNIDGQMQYLSYRCLCVYEKFRNVQNARKAKICEIFKVLGGIFGGWNKFLFRFRSFICCNTLK